MNIEITDKGRAEYDALVRDAMRYRWLRHCSISECLSLIGVHPGMLPGGSVLDAEIDAAMGASHE